MIRHLSPTHLLIYAILIYRSGKCIGDKNLKAFYLFTSMICFQFYYLLAALIYAFLYRYGYSALPHGPFF